MSEEYKIDYTGIQIPDIESIKRTSQQFTDWRKSMGFQTEEEKNAALKAEMQAAQQRFNDQDLWNSEDPYEVYNAYETNPAKQAEFQRNGQMVAGVGSTIATLPFTAGMMGWVPAITTTATGVAGGYAGAYGGQKLGQHLDNKYGWNTTPWLSTIGGIGGGILGGGMGYRGTIKLGSRGWLPKGGQTMYGKQFITDVASDALDRNVRQITPALNYGTVKYYGPTMGKTTAAKTNPNLVDFDDYVRGDLDILASQLGMTRQQLMMSQDPTVRENARQLMLKSIEGWRQNPSSYGKTLVISKSDVLQDPIFDNQPLVLQRPEFLKRNAARGETDLQNSMDWYASTRRKGGNKLMEWPDPEGVYISELEPFTPDLHHITFTPQPSKGTHTWFERPSTYFKGATYAGKPGTYAGKEVPTWQLPKGQRNQPHNPTATERIYSILGRDPDVPTGGVDLDLLEMNSASHHNLISMYEFLQKHGVDTKNITLADLENLYGMRLDAIRTASGGNYNLALPDATLELPGDWALPREWKIMGYDREGLVGSIDIKGGTRRTPQMSNEAWQSFQSKKPGASIKMIRNHTRPENHTMYDDPRTGSEVIEFLPRSQVSGVSQRMYDAAIPVAQQTNNGRGLMSGEVYLQPQRSTSVMEHYPTKKLINMSGRYHWEDLDPSRVTTTGPVWLLDTPSGRYKHIPTKSSLFFPSAIKDGQITTNINHGSIFLEDGGKIENPDY